MAFFVRVFWMNTHMGPVHMYRGRRSPTKDFIHNLQFESHSCTQYWTVSKWIECRIVEIRVIWWHIWVWNFDKFDKEIKTTGRNENVFYIILNLFIFHNEIVWILLHPLVSKMCGKYPNYSSSTLVFYDKNATWRLKIQSWNLESTVGLRI